MLWKYQRFAKWSQTVVTIHIIIIIIIIAPLGRNFRSAAIAQYCISGNTSQWEMMNFDSYAYRSDC